MASGPILAWLCAMPVANACAVNGWRTVVNSDGSRRRLDDGIALLRLGEQRVGGWRRGRRRRRRGGTSVGEVWGRSAARPG